MKSGAATGHENVTRFPVRATSSRKGDSAAVNVVILRGPSVAVKFVPLAARGGRLVQFSVALVRSAFGRTAEAREGFDEAVAMMCRLSPAGSSYLAHVLW